MLPVQEAASARLRIEARRGRRAYGMDEPPEGASGSSSSIKMKESAISRAGWNVVTLTGQAAVGRSTPDARRATPGSAAPGWPLESVGSGIGGRVGRRVDRRRVRAGRGVALG